MKRQRPVMRNGPWSGGPDDSTNIIPELRSFAGATADHAEFHPDRRAGVVLVLDLCFGKRGGIMNAPVDGFAPAIDITAFHEIEKRAGDSGLVVETHGQVRVIPAAEDAQALEVTFVLLDVAGGKLAAQLAKLRRRHFALATQLFFDLSFDRQPVTVPARHVRRVVPSHAPGFDHQILEDLVQTGSQMDFTGRIRWAVM